jgi:hypothetical protein
VSQLGVSNETAAMFGVMHQWNYVIIDESLCTLLLFNVSKRLSRSSDFIVKGSWKE